MAKELGRLQAFAKKKASEVGASELRLGLPELCSNMDAKFERAAGKRRFIDRTLRIGEWQMCGETIKARDDFRIGLIR